MNVPVTFYAILSNAIIIFNLLIVAKAIYSVHRKHIYHLHRRPRILFILFFPLILCISRCALILSFTIDNMAIYVVTDWVTALLSSIFAYRYKSILDDVIEMESIAMNHELAQSLKSEIRVRDQVQRELEVRNQYLTDAIIKLNNILENKMWLHDRQQTILELEAILTDLHKSKE